MTSVLVYYFLHTLSFLLNYIHVLVYGSPRPLDVVFILYFLNAPDCICDGQFSVQYQSNFMAFAGNKIGQHFIKQECIKKSIYRLLK